MTLDVNWTETAEQDRAHLLRHFRSLSAELAERFVNSTEHACQRLADFPYLAGIWESDDPLLAGIRVWPVPGFHNYLLFYRVTEQSIDILRFLYGRRALEKLLGS